jgi:hypothetical protein
MPNAFVAPDQPVDQGLDIGHAAVRDAASAVAKPVV